MIEKKLLEKSSVERFIEAYAKENRVLRFNSLRDKPDVLAEEVSSNTFIGIEVTHLFYDQLEAKLILGKSDDKSHPTMKEDEIIKTLNKRLKKKAKTVEEYKFEHEMILLIDVPSPMFDRELFEKFESEIDVPNTRYSEIWMLFNSIEGGFRLKQLQ